LAIARLASLAENPFAVLIGESIEVLVEESLEAGKEGIDGFIREAIARVGRVLGVRGQRRGTERFRSRRNDGSLALGRGC
jgi:hypothetical protein